MGTLSPQVLNRIDLVQKSIIREIRRIYRQRFTQAELSAPKDTDTPFYEKVKQFVRSCESLNDHGMDEDQFALFFAGFIEVD